MVVYLSSRISISGLFFPVAYHGDYVENYLGDYVGAYLGDYVRTYLGDYVRTYIDDFVNNLFLRTD